MVNIKGGIRSFIEKEIRPKQGRDREFREKIQKARREAFEKQAIISARKRSMEEAKRKFGVRKQQPLTGSVLDPVFFGAQPKVEKIVTKIKKKRKKKRKKKLKQIISSQVKSPQFNFQHFLRKIPS